MSRKKAKKKPTRPKWVIPVIIGVIGIAALAINTRLNQPDPGSLTYPTYTQEQINQGEILYQANCATCHGSEGRGNSRAVIPALDHSMHAWHHPDSQIAGMIRNGGFTMPAIGPDWSDEEITAVIAYIKEWWTPQQRASQASRADSLF